MSMESSFGAGAAIAAQEIINLVDELLEKYKDDEKIVKVLEQIKEKAEEIKFAGESGWY